MLVDQIISAKRSNINIHLQWVDIWGDAANLLI
ncbi:putative IS609 transposase TnpA [Escherichia coli]|nr:putative IS609 transposase TnpA [Escherichia coli]SQP43973.1 putative IS609 transposase TnpA [Escherichia coli]